MLTPETQRSLIVGLKAASQNGRAEFDVGGFFGVVLGALVISIVTSVLLFLVGRLFGEKQAA